MCDFAYLPASHVVELRIEFAHRWHVHAEHDLAARRLCDSAQGERVRAHARVRANRDIAYDRTQRVMRKARARRAQLRCRLRTP